jgi:hypothetical protein
MNSAIQVSLVLNVNTVAPILKTIESPTINEILLNATRQALMYQNTHNPNKNTNIY